MKSVWYHGWSVATMQVHFLKMKFLRGQANAAHRRIPGFTSTEVLLAMLAGAVLAVSVNLRIADRPAATPQAEIAHELDEIEHALRLYREDNQTYPTRAQGLEALVEEPGSLPRAPNWRQGGYLERMPLDPWGHRYRYVQPGRHGDFDVFSLGADNVPGGEGDNADIGNWAG